MVRGLVPRHHCTGRARVSTDEGGEEGALVGNLFFLNSLTLNRYKTDLFVVGGQKGPPLCRTGSRRLNSCHRPRSSGCINEEPPAVDHGQDQADERRTPHEHLGCRVVTQPEELREQD